MAFAVRISPKPVSDTIQLTLTIQEARTLKQMFGYIGGDPGASPRKHTDDISSALSAAGIYSANHHFLGDERGFFYADAERSTL